MKQLFLSVVILCCCLSGGATYAASVSGTVTSVSSCGPLSGQKVYLRDSFYAYIDSAVTNSSGVYSITFPSAWPVGKPFLITILTCGNVWNTTGHYTGVNATINTYVCGGPKTFYGVVMLGSLPNTGAAKVYLVKVQKNFPTAGDTTLTAVDSNILSTGGNYSFTRACAPTDTFLIKAALLPGHPSYASYLPSYDSSLTWNSALRYYGSSFSNFATISHDIYLKPGINPGGAGFIGGSVLAGANKQAAVGDPLASRILILINSATNAPVAYTYSNAAGKFSFPNVPLGTYKLFGDGWGFFNPVLIITVSSAKTNLSNIIFEENYIENTFKGRFSTTSVGTVSGPLAGVSVYPNPATTMVALKGIGQIQGSKAVVLRNLIGAVVSNKTFADGQPVEVAMDALPAGAYILQLTTSAGAASFKVVK